MTMTKYHLESVGLGKVDSHSIHQRDKNVEYLSGNMAEWQIAHKHLGRLGQFAQLASIPSRPYQLTQKQTIGQYTEHPFILLVPQYVSN